MRYQKLYQQEQQKVRDLEYALKATKEITSSIENERNSYRTQLDARIELINELQGRVNWLQDTLRLATLRPEVIRSISVKVPGKVRITQDERPYDDRDTEATDRDY